MKLMFVYIIIYRIIQEGLMMILAPHRCFVSEHFTSQNTHILFMQRLMRQQRNYTCLRGCIGHTHIEARACVRVRRHIMHRLTNYGMKRRHQQCQQNKLSSIYLACFLSAIAHRLSSVDTYDSNCAVDLDTWNRSRHFTIDFWCSFHKH